jgi:arabinofuranosyltransferase
LGVLLSLGSILFLWQVASRLNSAGSHVMPALFLGSSPALALWAISGMETALFISLLLVALYQLLQEEEVTGSERRRRYSSLLWLLLLALTRPEGVAVLLTLPIVRIGLWIWRGGEYRQRIPVYVANLAVAIVLFGLYFLWRYQYFGYLLPNTAYVKGSTGLGRIVASVGVYLIPYWLVMFPFASLALMSLSKIELKFSPYTYVLATLLVLTALNGLSWDWMPGYRLALPTTPLILLLAQPQLGGVLNDFRRRDTWQTAVNSMLIFALVCYSLAPFFYTSRLFHRVMANQYDMSIYRWAMEMQTIVDGQYVAIGRWLAEHAPEDATVAAANIGAISYLSQLRVIDMFGLTSEKIAHQGMSVEWVLAQEPEFIVVESDTRDELSGKYCTFCAEFLDTQRFQQEYEPVLVLDNGRTEEDVLFIHHLPHASWLFARKDLSLTRH